MTPQQVCVQCDEAITNPICTRCLGQEMEAWMRERDESLLPRIELTTMSFAAYTHEVTRCILCGKRMSVCAHCVVEEAADALGREEVAEELREQFSY
ncbi:hypothetical protein HY491_00270 [Candidatus Woesearchaeota archaeon]|nr:hypothetical protein [Candidatus Woesearchaeota archaeon]